MIRSLLKPVDLSVHPSRKRATILQATGGYINTGIVIIQGLLLIPLYLHYIGAHTYGLWLASGGMLGMLGLMNFGISSLVIQRIASAYAQKNFPKAGAYFINGALIYLGICLLYAIAGQILSIWLPAILKVTGDDAELLSKCFQIAVLAMVIAIFNECLRSFCQALLRPVVSEIGIVIGRIIGIGVTVWMLFNDFGLWSIPVGTLITECVIFILNQWYAFVLFRHLEAKMRLDLNIIKEYIRTSPALLMSRVGNTVSKESEPLLITMFLSPEVTTAYMVTRRAADIVFRLLSVIAGSTMSSFAHLAGSGDSDKSSRVAKKILSLGFVAGVIGFATYVGANQVFVSLWVGDLLVLDQKITLFIALGFFAGYFRGLTGHMLYGLGDFVFPSTVVLLEGIVRVSLAILLLNTIGVIGVPLAFTLSCLVSVVPLSFRLKNELSMRFNIPEIIRFLFTGAVIFWVSISVVQLDFDVNSWIVFSLYLVILLTVILSLQILMNWRSSREIFKSIVT